MLHETGHLLELSDRYTDNSERTKSISHKGFENDFMGARGNVLISPIHYKIFAESIWRFDGKSFINNRTIDKDSRQQFIHTPESDEVKQNRMKRRLQ